MQGPTFTEDDFFDGLASSGARVLLIGRRALIAYGIPVMTADYDLWLHFDDIETLNEALASLALDPNWTPAEARARGRYVLEGDEHVDVVVARSTPTRDTGEIVSFEAVWEAREQLTYRGSTTIAVPCLDDLIRTKKWGLRARDLPDIEQLEALRSVRNVKSS